MTSWNMLTVASAFCREKLCRVTTWQQQGRTSTTGKNSAGGGLPGPVWQRLDRGTEAGRGILGVRLPAQRAALQQPRTGMYDQGLCLF